MKKVICVLGAATALFSASRAARADSNVVGASDVSHPAEPTPSFAASRAGAFVDLWPAKKNFATTFGAEMQLRLSKQVFLDMSYGGAFASIHDALDNGNYLGFGNPMIGVHFAGAAAPNLHLFVGGGVTLPVLHDPGQGIANAAFYGARIRGYYDADRFARGHVAVRAAGGLEWHAGGPLFLRAEVRPVVYIPTNDKYPVLSKIRAGLPEPHSGEAGLMLEDAVEAEVRADMGLGFGVRFQSVMMPMEADLVQTAVEPFLGLSPKRRGFYMRVGFPLALDPDLGFGFEEDKVAGVRFNLGGQW